MKQNSNFDEQREQYLMKGTDLIHNELHNQADYVMEIQNDIRLKNIDTLSSSIIANRNINKSIKQAIQEYGNNIGKLILATAYYIDSIEYEDTDNKLGRMKLNKFDMHRLSGLLNAQRKLTLSFQTLSTTVEIFKRINEQLLSDIDNSPKATTPEAKMQKTKLYLKNAIIIYELTHFVTNRLESFGLEGIQDILDIKVEVFSDIEINKKNDEILQRQLEGRNESLREATEKDLTERQRVRELIIKKWQNMLEQISSLQQKVGDAKGYIEDLRIIRDNARNQIDVINLIATTQVVQNTLQVIGGLSDIRNWAIAPLNEKTACELLGIGISETEI